MLAVAGDREKYATALGLQASFQLAHMEMAQGMAKGNRGTFEKGRQMEQRIRAELERTLTTGHRPDPSMML